MKVESVEVFRVDMPMRDFFKNANHNHNVQPSVVVRVTSDDGFTGIGDVEPVAGYSGLSRDDIADAVERKLAPALIGANPRASREITRKMDEACDGFDGGKGALSLAMADLHAKSLSVPLYELLGGAVKKEVRFNAWIGIKAPDEAGREARGFYERGWRACKVKTGGDVESDAARVLAVRESTGDDFEIRIDANESYGNVEDAIALAREVEGADIQHFEQPVPRTDIEGLARVRRSINIPVMADECVFGPESLLEIIRAEAADIVKVKIMKQGGPLRVRDMVGTAEAAGMKLVIGHGFGLSPYTLGEIHVAATSNAFLAAIESVGPEKMLDDVVDSPVDMSTGRHTISGAPGLGVALDEDRIEKYLTREVVRV